MEEAVNGVRAAAGKNYMEESIFIPFGPGERLHLYRLCGSQNGPPVFMLHGSIENGRIFYSSSGKGLAPFLAANGYDVYVADLRGRGESTPPLGRHSVHGVISCINEEIPCLLDAIRERRGRSPQAWVAHSWGGVELLASLAVRQPLAEVRAMVFFGTKRRILMQGLRKFIAVEIYYRRMFRIISLLKGYVDVRWLGVGSDNESEACRRETYEWVTNPQWKDAAGFDYAAALRRLNLPPALYLSGAKDLVLGHPEDVEQLIREIRHEKAVHRIVSRHRGNLHDYDHINLLTHPDAPKDHFQEVLQFLDEHLRR